MLNVRQGPGTDFEKVGAITRDSVLIELGRQGQVPELTDLPPLGRIQVRLRVPTERRGVLALGRLTLATRYPSGFDEVDAETLQQAYAYCDALTSEHSKTFYTASALMPPENMARDATWAKPQSA